MVYSRQAACDEEEEAWLGMKTEKTVPECPVVRLFRRILPDCFCPISEVTQSPSPVPVLDFVLTKGVNIRERISRETPEPVSAMEMRTPGRKPLVNSRA